ncbi:biotin/lipoyl-binding protein [Roseomonas alkaliterrae]|uniref:3-methylcrotonyl-CoA carboxylase alpha subunit n=1 Tax=Neoroseomonas alkaliterrae TaxID=1452450 RepID=A0A840Y4J7_9PROT|nr:biotin carboxylase N-terminal domain-containing protein [Neoroseomonas alkaliterrae]MBB5689073.1 3-methylcrotonyl-CoA carboxylase alpha subunit [Neoroseomonas alkaliterrae]MBR0674618.1 biotin/lipoyl-binding protein [Neoroseomonas alkaliterrae]
MFRSLLIANRGEIACRIMRTARRMGIRCIAVFSEADADALHVAMADEAHPIGPPPARDSYLRAERIIEVARASGAEAIHPGYGFLSENADFAEACSSAGIVFVGPPASAIRAMGSKADSKALMVAAGVPVVPGYHGEDQSEERLAAEAARIGFPLLIKASAGGGGKGMRPVHSAADFLDELAGARREARAAFGDDRVLLERYLQRPRHVEVQVFADRHGRTIHLHTRDCSVQRRHQKVLEEAPAPDLSPALRERLHAAAVAAARAVGYVNAGTVEFIVEGDDAFFMEMNTRLQVEHPVTEMITGLDLVEWQLRVAAGEPLPFEEPPEPRGHAVEVRLYAEDPAAEFRPSVGALKGFSGPAEREGVRLDTGVRSEDRITAHYDPMIAKIIAAAPERRMAFERLGAALAETRLGGLATNLAFLRRLVAHPAMVAGDLDTGFIARHAAALIPPPREVPPEALAAFAAVHLERLRQRHLGDSPWDRLSGFRLFGPGEEVLLLRDDVGVRRIVLHRRRGAMAAIVDGGTAIPVAADLSDGSRASVDGVWRHVSFSADDGVVALTFGGEDYGFRLLDPYAPRGGEAAAEGRLSAPIPGRVVQVLVAAGDRVARGQVVAILEAMKTELRIVAPADGIVAHVGCAAGDSIEEGTEIVTLAPPDESASPP